MHYHFENQTGPHNLQSIQKWAVLLENTQHNRKPLVCYIRIAPSQGQGPRAEGQGPRAKGQGLRVEG